MNYEIIDNALSEEDLLQIQDVMMYSSKFPWYLNDEITTEKEKSSGFYATHMFFYNGADADHKIFSDPEKVNVSPWISIMQPVLKILNPKSILRVKGNFYPRTNFVEEHQPHIDYPFCHSAALFYVNTCNGFTRLEDGSIIDSVANRLLLFDGSLYHNSTTCTDQTGRFNINFNFF